MVDPRLRARYGRSAPALPAPAETTVLDSLLAHKSVRHFQPEPLPPGTLEWLVAAAQSAATSSNLQTWSVVALQDPEHKAAAAALCADQDFIRQAPLFLVFCADLSRLTFVSEQVGFPGEGLEYLEMFLMASLDAALAAQNAVVAAEAQGLGICYVGAARNQPKELAALLHLPPRVFAVFGLAVGRPSAQDTSAVKPRLPQEEVLHREVYSTAPREQALAEYNQTLREFSTAQGRVPRADWDEHSARRVSTAEHLTGRHVLREVLQASGFALK